jgi:hypothetical protein
MTSKIRTKYKNKTQRCNKTLQRCNKNAIKGTQLKCKLKSCKAKMYQSVYGLSEGGSIRSNSYSFS